MKKRIKNISCFGTSCTAGGGFEFNSNYNITWQDGNDFILGKQLKNLYKGFVDTELSQYKFAFPNHLQNLVRPHGIKVDNYSKSGFGNEKVYREVFNVVNSESFDKDTHLLFIEITGLGRKELYSKELQDYIIVNYLINDDNEIPPAPHGMNHTWWDTSGINDIVNGDNEIILNNFLDFSLEASNQLDCMIRNLTMFFSWLKYNNINFVITHWLETRSLEANSIVPSYVNDIVSNHITNWNIFGKEYLNWINMVNDLNLRIWDETNGIIQDNHFSYYGHKLIAHILYNQFIAENLETEKILLSEKDFLNKSVKS